MIIRWMEEEDLLQVIKIEQELFTDAWSEAAFRESLQQENARFLVAVLLEDAFDIVGYCGSYRAFDEAEIVNVAVSADRQNEGIGYAMVSELMKQDQEDGVSNFVLEVRESNASAQHLYEKLGFEKIGVRKNFYTYPTEHAVIMQCILGEA